MAHKNKEFLIEWCSVFFEIPCSICKMLVFVYKCFKTYNFYTKFIVRLLYLLINGVFKVKNLQNKLNFIKLNCFAIINKLKNF